VERVAVREAAGRVVGMVVAVGVVGREAAGRVEAWAAVRARGAVGVVGRVAAGMVEGERAEGSVAAWKEVVRVDWRVVVRRAVATVVATVEVVKGDTEGGMVAVHRGAIVGVTAVAVRGVAKAAAREVGMVAAGTASGTASALLTPRKTRVHRRPLQRQMRYLLIDPERPRHFHPAP
jgi:hypothetical protein